MTLQCDLLATVTLQPAFLDRCDLGGSISGSTLSFDAYSKQMYDFQSHAAGENAQEVVDTTTWQPQ